MIWWLVIGLVVGSLLILAVAGAALLRRLRELGIVVRRLRLRVNDAQRVVPAVTALRERAERVQQELTAIQQRPALPRASRVS